MKIQLIAAIAIQNVVACQAAQCVIAFTTADCVVARVASNGVCSLCADQYVVSGSGCKHLACNGRFGPHNTVRKFDFTQLVVL